jgi:3-dehydroquinate dehydratase-2
VRIAVLNGPNLNLLGTREPDVYGTETLEEIEQMVKVSPAAESVEMDWFQSNHEGQLVETIQSLADEVDGFVINAAALTHTSVALRDCLLGVSVPFVEVHISNIFAREEFRHKSLLSDIAVGLVCGFGAHSYVLGTSAIVRHLENQ